MNKIVVYRKRCPSTESGYEYYAIKYPNDAEGAYFACMAVDTMGRDPELSLTPSEAAQTCCNIQEESSA